MVVDGPGGGPYARRAVARRPSGTTDAEVHVRPDDEDSVETGDPGPTSGPCAAEVRIANERCALARLLQERLAAARGELDGVQRAYDDLEVRRAEATAVADERAIRRTKDAAQAEFRRARIAAKGPVDIQAAATTWLDEISRENGAVVAARLELEDARAESGRLVAALERITAQVEALRVAAANSAVACRAAQERLAACLVAHGGGAAVMVAAFEAQRPGEAAEGTEADAADDAMPGEEVADGGGRDAAAAVDLEGEPAIFAVLRGDEVTRQRLAEALGGADEEAVTRWSTRIAALADAIIDRAMEASRFEYPAEHPFWGWFTRAECRDIAVALASLGHRPDRTGAFVEGHVPTRHDLSLAVVYAGQDPVRIRTWPSAASMETIFAGTVTNAAAFLAEEAGDLTLGEMVTLLGRHAERLTDLWLDWDRIRPLLLAPVG
jgi:hypothetical protein